MSSTRWRLCIALWNTDGARKRGTIGRLDGIYEWFLDPEVRLDFGRSQTADLVLKYRSVARRHGHFRLEEDGAFIAVDHNSSNSVQLEGIEGRKRTLMGSSGEVLSGDAIYIGQLLLRVSKHVVTELERVGRDLTIDEQIVWLRGISHARSAEVEDAAELSVEAPSRLGEEARHYLERTHSEPVQTRWFASALELSQQVLCGELVRGWFSAGVPLTPAFAREPLVALTQTYGPPHLYKLEVYQGAVAIITHHYPPEVVKQLGDEVRTVGAGQDRDRMRALRGAAFAELLDALDEDLYVWS